MTVGGSFLSLGGCIPPEILQAIQSPQQPQDLSAPRDEAKDFYDWEKENPQLLIRYSQEIKDMIWNDPSIIRNGETYTMWLGGGKLSDRGKDVKVYMATSPDGLQWQINPEPLVVPGAKGEFDEKGIETPSVVKVGGIFHMYYTGANFTDSHMGRFSIGHATSTDGIHWKKDPNNPAIPRTFNGEGPGEGRPNAWGWLSVAEPGVVYHKGQKKFYVYYVASKLRKDDFTGAEPKTQMGIMVATSTDGSHFTTHPAPVLIQTANYPHEQGYYGYSTPSAFIDKEGRFHLFYDAARYVSPGQSFLQVALVHAVSDDGFHFKEMDTNIVTIAQGGWMRQEVRAPFPIEDEHGRLRLYFAGGWTDGGIGLIRASPKQ